jgi:leader peptidase (prepilin peptidase)/N-methyltransferase
MVFSGVSLIVLWGVLGWLVGGFLAALAVALPSGGVRVVLSGRCPACGRPLQLLSIVLARGRDAERCPNCRETTREAWPITEATAALAFGSLAARFPFEPALGVYTVLAAILVLVLFIDVRHRLILDVVTLPCIVVAIPLAFMTVGIVKGLLGGLVAGGFFLAFYLLARVIYRRGGALGLGDVKLALLIGLVVGMPSALTAVVYSAIAGGILAIGYLAVGRSRYTYMPYGPSLVLGALVTILLDANVWR